MLRKVYLEGELGEKYGRELEISAVRPAEVFQCLGGNYPDFKKYLLDCEERGVGFTVEVGGEQLDEEECLLLLEEGDILVTPIPAGSKSGVGKILAAVAIAAFIVINPFAASTIFSTGVGTGAAGLSTFGTVLAGISVNLALTGIQQLMAPDPSVDSDQDESYLFNGPEQNIVEGDPVPVLYGRLRVPGQPISFEVLNRKLTGATEVGVNNMSYFNITGPYGAGVNIG